METLHLRAETGAVKVLMELINKVSQDGNNIEILDNTVYEQEQKMIFQALIEEKQAQTYEHDELWNDLLK